MIRRMTCGGVALLAVGALFGCSGKALGESPGNAGGGGQAGNPLVDGGSSGIGPEAGRGGADATGSPLFVASAWQVTISTKWTDPATSISPGALEPTVEATLDVFEDAGAWKGILSRDGRLAVLGLIRRSGAAVSFDAPPESISFSLAPDASPLTELQFSNLNLTAIDDDADGVADRITGLG